MVAHITCFSRSRFETRRIQAKKTKNDQVGNVLYYLACRRRVHVTCDQSIKSQGRQLKFKRTKEMCRGYEQTVTTHENVVMFRPTKYNIIDACETFRHVSLHISSLQQALQSLPLFKQTVGRPLHVFQYTAAVDFIQQPRQAGFAQHLTLKFPYQSSNRNSGCWLSWRGATLCYKVDECRADSCAQKKMLLKYSKTHANWLRRCEDMSNQT